MSVVSESNAALASVPSFQYVLLESVLFPSAAKAVKPTLHDVMIITNAKNRLSNFLLVFIIISPFSNDLRGVNLAYENAKQFRISLCDKQTHYYI